MIRRELFKMGDYFRAIEVLENENNPEIYQECLKKLNISLEMSIERFKDAFRNEIELHGKNKKNRVIGYIRSIAKYNFIIARVLCNVVDSKYLVGTDLYLGMSNFWCTSSLYKNALRALTWQQRIKLHDALLKNNIEFDMSHEPGETVGAFNRFIYPYLDKRNFL